jgi:hypothetical protein
MKFFDEHTSIQAEKLVQPYLKKWMRIPNTVVYNINDRGDEGYRVSATISNDNGPLVHLYFDKRWNERISILRRGSTLAIIGQIVSVETHGLRLENCEILYSGAGTHN